LSIRFTIIYASLIIVGGLLVLFLMSPVIGLPLDTEKGQHIQVMQIAIPTFISYLSAAVTYATVRTAFPEPSGERGKILRTIVTGSLTVFIVGFSIATIIFAEAGNGRIPNGLNFQQYTVIITLLLGILGATTSSVSTFIFASKGSDNDESRPNER
jgi:hypothetical protein